MDDSTEHDLCSICLTPVINNSLRLKCSHLFHTHCINDFRSFKNSNWKSCSLCRQELSSEDVAYIISHNHICEICSHPFNAQNPMYNLSCGHFFHFICMISKLKSQKCFVCEQDYPEGVVKNADYNYKLRMGHL